MIRKILTDKILLFIIIYFVAVLVIIFSFKQKSLLNHLRFFNYGYRFEAIDDCDRGFDKTKVYLLQLNSGADSSNVKPYSPIENIGDDVGIYYYVIWLKNTFHLPSTGSSYVLFFSFIIFLSFCIANIGFTLLLTNPTTKIIAFIGVMLFSLFCFCIMDVYVLAFLAVATIPLIIYIYSNSEIGYATKFVLSILAGYIVGFSNVFRNHAGTGLLIFILIYSILNYQKGNKYLNILLLCLTLLASQIESFHMNYVKSLRNHWITLHKPLVNYNENVVTQHLFWHPMYLGLAFQKNEYGIEWSDNSGYAKANTTDTRVNANFKNCDGVYENILKKEYLFILKTNTKFVIINYLKKTLYIFAFLLISLNIGIFYLFKYDIKIYIPIIITIIFYLLPGVLVWPYPMYFLGSIFLAFFLNIIVIDHFYTNLSRKRL